LRIMRNFCLFFLFWFQNIYFDFRTSDYRSSLVM